MDSRNRVRNSISISISMLAWRYIGTPAPLEIKCRLTRRSRCIHPKVTRGMEQWSTVVLMVCWLHPPETLIDHWLVNDLRYPLLHPSYGISISILQQHVTRWCTVITQRVIQSVVGGYKRCQETDRFTPTNQNRTWILHAVLGSCWPWDSVVTC